MPVPATLGQLKTDLQSMEIGDYIACKYTASSGAAGVFSDLGATAETVAAAGEIGINGDSAPHQFFYFIKAKENLLIADRVVQNMIQWGTLNAAGYIQGKVMQRDLCLGLTASDVEVDEYYLDVHGNEEIGYNAIDGNIDSPQTIWQTNGTDKPHWIIVDLKEAKNIDRIEMYPYAVTGSLMSFKNFNIYFSNDRTGWIKVGSGVGASTLSWTAVSSFSTAGAYRYVKVEIIDNYFSGNVYSGISELRILGKDVGLLRSLSGGSTYIKGNGEIVADCPWNGGDITNQEYIIDSGNWGSINYAFDNIVGSHDTGWEGLPGYPCWVGQDFKTSIIINKYTMQAPSDYYNSGEDGASPYSWNFEGSNDMTDWTVLHSVTGKIWGGSEKVTYNISNTTAYRYYRINITEQLAGGGTCFSMINEIEMSEDVTGVPNTGCFPSRNEFDSILINSDLNGTTTANNDTVWHHETTASFCRETFVKDSGRYKIKRDKTSATIKGMIDDYGIDMGFRPVLEIVAANSRAKNIWY